MQSISNRPSKSPARFAAGFLRILVLSLLAAAFTCTSLHAQSVAYVVNSGSNNVSVIDTGSNTVTATIPVGNTPIGVVFSPDGTRAYVTNFADSPSGTVSVIDTGANAVIATIAVGGSPVFPAITPDGKNLYVTDFNGAVRVVSTVSNTLTATITVPAGASPVVITPDGTRAYVLTFGAVSVINTATNTVVGSPITVTSLATGPGLAITPSGSDVYVAGQAFSVVSALATSSNTVTATVQFPTGQAPTALAMSPDGARVYVSDSNGNTVSIIDTSTNTLEPTSIQVGTAPDGLAVTPDGAFLYAANSGDGTISVIATATDTVVGSPIHVGSSPEGIAIANLSSTLAAFTVEDLDIHEHKLNFDGDFTLGGNSGGLDFGHQPLTLTVGSFSLTVPAGKLKQVGGQHHFIFNGAINGLRVNIDIHAEHGSSTAFDYSIQVKGVDVDAANPVHVTLKIGHNSGTATVNQN